MKKVISIFVVVLSVSFFTSCKKDLVPDPSVQRPDLGSEIPVGPYASIEVRNKTGDVGAMIDSVYSFSSNMSGGAFPLEKNDRTILYSTYFGKQTLFVAVRGGINSSVRVVDAENTVYEREVTASGPAVVAFENVIIEEGSTLQVSFLSSSSAY